MKRSAAAIAAALHWNGTKSKKTKVESEVVSVPSDESVTEISSDELLTLLKNEPTPLKNEPTSAIKLFYNPSYELHDSLSKHASEYNQDTVTLNELIGIKDLDETFQFNFSIDIPFFLTHMHPEFVKRKRKITFITGRQQLSVFDEELQNLLSIFNLNEIIADLPDRFGTHHTKMMINFFENQLCEVVIMTCNITKLDIGGLTQMCWRSGRLALGTTKPDSMGYRFQRDLTDYLKRYKKKKLSELANRIMEYDFSSINVELVASAPGYFDMDDITTNSEVYGFGKLYQVLKRNNLLIKDTSKHHNMLSQVSSIAYPVVSEKFHTSSIFTHILCPLIFDDPQFSMLSPGRETTRNHQKLYNYTPTIVYPTAQEVSQANVGFGAGASIHFNYTRSHAHENQYKQNILPYLHKWTSKADTAGRNHVPPHVKLYLCDNGDEWKSIKWALLCSHNLSKQAWGAPKSKHGRTYHLASYDLGVLVPGTPHTLTPTYLHDHLKNCLAPLRLPFKVPPEPYGDSDQPWSPHMNFGELKDRFGNTYQP